LAEQVDRFVDTIGQKQLRRRYSKEICHRRFYGFSLGISRELFRANMPQAVENPRRAPDGVFVDVEAQAIPPSEGRVVRRQRADRFPWAKHGYTSHAQNEHAHASLQSPPDTRLFSQSAAIH
jgi:hypothetical protein